MNCELVVFDMAGTTVWDPDFVGQAVIDALADDGISITRDDINPYMGIPKPIAIRKTLEDIGHEAAGDASRVERLFEGFRANMLTFYRTSPDEAADRGGGGGVLIGFMRMGGRWPLDTGFSRDIVDVILERLGWADGRLDASVASTEVENGRPHADLVFEAMKRTGVTEVSKVAKVGDTPSDLGEGVAAGCGWVVGVTEGTHTRSQLEGHGATHLIGTVAELPGVLD